MLTHGGDHWMIGAVKVPQRLQHLAVLIELENAPRVNVGEQPLIPTPATTLNVSVRPDPTKPNTPVICPAKTESELFFTIAAMRKFSTDNTRFPAGRTDVFCRPYRVRDKSRPGP